MKDTGKSDRVRLPEETKLVLAMSAILLGYLIILGSIVALFINAVTVKEVYDLSVVVAIIVLLVCTLIAIIPVREDKNE